MSTQKLVQGPLVLPLPPPEEGPAFRRAPDRDDPLSRPAPPLHLRHPQDDGVPEPAEGLRPYFRFDRNLLRDLCRIAHACLLEYLRATLDLPEGLPGIVMTIHTFGEYLDRVLPDERDDLERLAQYIIRNPFAVEKMQVSTPNRANPEGSVIYRSGR